MLDLSAVSYIDSATIGCLVEIHRLLADQGGAVKLAALQRRVHTMLSMTGVDKFLEVYAGEDEALASIGWTADAYPPRLRAVDSGCRSRRARR